MRVNVYTEELIIDNEDNKPVAEIVIAEYVSSRTHEKMKNYGLRIYLKSPPELHYIPGRDDDRSAVTFWCGDSKKKVFAFWDLIKECAQSSTLDDWRSKTEERQGQAEAELPGRPPAPSIANMKQPYEELGFVPKGQAEYIYQNETIYGWSESNIVYERAWWLYVNRTTATPSMIERVDRILRERPFPRSAFDKLPKDGFFDVEYHQRRHAELKGSQS